MKFLKLLFIQELRPIFWFYTFFALFKHIFVLRMGHKQLFHQGQQKAVLSDGANQHTEKRCENANNASYITNQIHERINGSLMLDDLPRQIKCRTKHYSFKHTLLRKAVRFHALFGWVKLIFRWIKFKSHHSVVKSINFISLQIYFQ